MLLILSIKVFAKTTSPQASPIFHQIIKNNPTIDKNYAVKLSSLIDKIHKVHKIDSKILTAMLMQESSYKLNVLSKSNDYSIGQINIKTIKYYNFDKNRLLIDLDYSINCTAQILKDLKKNYKEPNYWSRYNTSHKIKRKKYEQLVMRYMWKS